MIRYCSLLTIGILAAMACDSTYTTKCVNPVSMQGAWEGRDEGGVWWRFDLTETSTPGVGFKLTGSYTTDYVYHLELADPDTISGAVGGGLSCLASGSVVMDELMLRFDVEHPGGIEYCSLTGTAYHDPHGERVGGGLKCGSRDVQLDLHRADYNPSASGDPAPNPVLPIGSGTATPRLHPSRITSAGSLATTG